MSTTIGSLIAELGMDDSSFNDALSKAHANGLTVVRNLEKEFSNITKNIKLNLTPKVDHKPLTELNKHFDKKEKHAKSLQSYFDRNPLTPRFDDSSLNTLENRISQINKKQIGVSVKSGSRISSSTVGDDSRDVIGVLKDINNTNKNIYQAVKSVPNLPQNIASQTQPGAVSKAASTAGKVISAPTKILTDAAGSVASGAFENVGREVTADFSKGLSAGINRELSFLIGSFDKVGSTLGQNLIKGVLDSFGRDADMISKILENAIGKETILVEGAAVRGKQSAESRSNRRFATSQAQAEFGFVRNNKGEISNLAEQLDKEANDLAKKEEEIRNKIKETENKLGIEDVAQALDISRRDYATIQSELLDQLNKQAKAREDIDTFSLGVETATNPASEKDAQVRLSLAEKSLADSTDMISVLQAQGTLVSGNIDNLTKRVEMISRIASERFEGLTKELIHADDLLANQQRRFQRYVDTVQTFDLLGSPVSSSTDRQQVGRQQKQTAPEQDLRNYQLIANEVAKRSGVSLDSNNLPNIVVNDEGLRRTGAQAGYTNDSNSIHITSSLNESLQQGTLTNKQLETLVHELRHAAQYGFGSGAENSIAVSPLELTPDEKKQFGHLIEGSVNVGGGGTETHRRIIESDAYAFQNRETADIGNVLSRQLAIDSLQSTVGIGGAKLKEAFFTIEKEYTQQLLAIQNDMDPSVERSSFDVNESPEAANVSKSFALIRQRIRDLADSTIDLEDLSTDEIIELQARMVSSLEKSDSLLKKQVEKYEASVKGPSGNNKPAQKMSTPKQSNVGDPWETASDVANLTGKALRNAIEATQKELFILNHSIKITADIMRQGGEVVGSIYKSAPVQSFVSSVGQATQAMGAVAGAGYQIASGVEAVALDMLPMGKTAKGVLQQTAVPAAMFGAGAHFLPGGEMAAGYLMDSAANALGPAGAAVSQSLGAGATEAITGAIPNVLGLSQALSGATTGAIEMVTNGAVQIVANAGVAIAGGKAIQQGMKSAIPSLPGAEPLQLPQSSREKEAILVDAKPATKAISAAQKSVNKATTNLNKSLKSAKTKSTEVVTSLDGIDTDALKSANISRAKEIGTKFQEAYAIFKDLVDKGNVEFATTYADVIKSMAEQAKQDIESLISELSDAGADISFGSDASNKINAVKGQIIRKRNEVNRFINKKPESQGVGKDISEGMANGMDTSTVENAAEDLAQSAIDAAKDTLDIQSPSKVFERIGRFVMEGFNMGLSKESSVMDERITEEIKAAKEAAKKASIDKEITTGQSDAEQALTNADVATAKFNKAESEIEQRFAQSQDNLDATLIKLESEDESLGSRIARIFKADKKLNQTVGKTANLLKLAVGAVVGVEVGSLLLDFGKQLAVDSTQAALGLEQMTIQLTRLEVTAAEAQDKIKELRSEADRLGVSGTQAIGGYVQIAASTQGTVLEGSATDQIASAAVQASSGLSLNAEQADRVTIAMAQMASKGKISAEEIRGQMGDVLPGAFQIAARSMGMTTQEFDKLMSTGQVFSEDFLPRFAQQLQAEVPAATDSAQASINRFNSQVDQFRETIGKPMLSAQSLGLDILTSGLDKLQDILPLIGTLVLTLGANFVMSFTKATLAALGINKAVILSTLSVSNLTKVVSGLGPAAIKAAKAFGQLALKFAVMQGIIDVFSIIGKATSDSAKETNNFTKDAIAGMEKYRDAIAEVRNEVKGLSSDLPKNRDELKNTSLLEGTIIGGASRAVLGEDAGNSFVRNAESNLVKNAARFTIPGLLFDQGSKLTGGEGLVSYAEKAANDQSIAFNEMMMAVNDTLSSAYTQLGADGKGVAELGRLGDIDAQLNDLNQRRQATSPGDSEARLKIEKEINSLLEEREGITAATGALQGNIAKQIEFLNKYKETLEERKNAGAITESDYDKELNMVNSALDDLTTTQERFNTINRQSTDQLKLLSRALADVMVQLESDTFKNQIAAGQQGVNLARARLSGATEGQTQYSGALLQRDQLNTQITTNTRAITGLENNLGSTEYTDALDKIGLSIESTSFEIQRGLEGLQDGSLKATLEKVVEFKGNLETLQLDTLNLEEQMIQAQIDANQQIRESNQQIAEYFRSVANTAEELEADVKEIESQTEFNEIKNKLNSAMSGLSGSFFDGWIGGFMGFLDSLQDIVQSRIDADRQRMQAQQQQFADMQQLNQMQMGLPGTIPGLSTGGTFSSPLAGQTVQSLIDYQPSKEIGQDFRAPRDNGARIHSGIDIDSRAGGGLGDQVLASLGGTASIYDIGEQYGDVADSVGIAITSQLGNGIPIEIRYNHLNLNDVKRDLGVGIGDTTQVAAGQALGTVVNHHLDYKVSVNGEYVNPQEFMQAMLNGGGMASTVDGRSIQIVAGGSSQTERTQLGSTNGLTVKGQQATQDQIAIARQIYEGGIKAGANSREIEAAIATAIQESVLTNLSGGDRDSSGIFQQRPSMEWGTASQIQSVPFAVESFFNGRGSNRGMIENRSVANGDVYLQSHETQRSAHPDAPREWDSEAKALLQAVSGSMPTTTAVGVNRGQFNQAAQGASVNNDLQMDLINRRAGLSESIAQAQADLQLKGLLNQGQEQLRNIEDRSLEIEQQIQDRAITAIPQGDLRSSVESTIDTARQGGEETTGLSRQLQDSGRELDAARDMLAQLENNRGSIVEQISNDLLDESALSSYDTAIEQFRTLIDESEQLDSQLRALQAGALDDEATKMLADLTMQTEDAKAAGNNLDPIIAATQGLKRELDALEQNASTYSEIFRDSIDDRHTEQNVELLVSQFEELNNVKLDNIRREIDEITRGLEIAQENALIEFETASIEELNRVLARSGKLSQAQENSYTSLLRRIDNEEKDQLLKIDQSTQLTDPQKAEARKAVTEGAEAARTNANYDQGMLQRTTRLDQSSALLDSRRSVFNEAQSQADLLGFGGISSIKQADMQLSLDEQSQSFESQLIELEKMRETLGLTNEQFEQMRSNIETTNELSIQNIKTQFSELPEIIGAIKQPMTDALSSWIQGTKSFDEAFSDMISNILGNLISMMANKAIEGFLGSLFGGMGGFGGGQTAGIGGGGLLGSIFGGIFNTGGKIGPGGSSMAYQGLDNIKSALKQEGPKGRIIVANTDEWVLNKEHQAMLAEYGITDKTLGFKDGGKVGGSSPSISVPSGSGSVSVSMPLTVNNQGGQDVDGDELLKSLKDPIISMIHTQIERQQRPGGQLRRRTSR